MSEDVDRAVLEGCECVCGKLACASVRGGRTHGARSTYRAGCRCADCTAAADKSAHERYKRRLADTLPTATKSGQHWTGPEMEVAMREDLTVTEIAKMLGRTYKAVAARRALCRSDPKWANAAGVAQE